MDTTLLIVANRPAMRKSVRVRIVILAALTQDVGPLTRSTGLRYAGRYEIQGLHQNRRGELLCGTK
jgi:hypothetical protein